MATRTEGVELAGGGSSSTNDDGPTLAGRDRDRPRLWTRRGRARIARDHLRSVARPRAGSGRADRRPTVVIDLLFTPAIPPHPDLPYSTSAALRSLASLHLAAPRTSGADLLAKRRLTVARSADQFLTTSIDELDVLLGGGWRPGSVVEVAGPKGGGKSLLVLYSVLSCLILHEDARVTWIDTEGGFDAHRCLAVTKLLLEDLRESAGISFTDAEGRFDDQAKGMEVMDRLGVSRLSKSGVALDAIVSELLGHAPGEHAPPSTRLVVIDSLVPLLGGDALTSPSAQGSYFSCFFTIPSNY